jgi:lysophospholipid acyltransferase (LPLAT)-like uncharacterized protein
MLSMKIRHPFLIKTLGLAAAVGIKTWIGTLRYRYRSLGPDLNPLRTDLDGRYIYAIWHENLLLPVYQYSRANVWVIISQHADGELLTEIGRHVRMKLVRGSTRRGGVEAVRKLLRISRSSHLAITPDGPRGPRRQVQAGLVYLAARTGLPVVPTGFGYQRPWRLRSWDRFVLPRPWTVGTCVTGAPIVIPAEVGKGDLEHYRQLVEDRLLHASAVAERWAEHGRFHAGEPLALAG